MSEAHAIIFTTAKRRKRGILENEIWNKMKKKYPDIEYSYIECTNPKQVKTLEKYDLTVDDLPYLFIEDGEPKWRLTNDKINELSNERLEEKFSVALSMYSEYPHDDEENENFYSSRE